MPEPMKEVEILLVEDNPTDAELTIRALRKNNFANKLVWTKDGAEALDFIFCTAAYSSRNMADVPKVILLDLQLPKVNGLKCYAGSRRTVEPGQSPLSCSPLRKKIAISPKATSLGLTATSASQWNSTPSIKSSPNWGSTGW